MEIKNKLLSLEKEIQELKKKKEEYTKWLIGRRKKIYKKITNLTINTDILILGDSNTKYIKEDILDNRKTCKKVFCAMYTDIQLFCTFLQGNDNNKAT